MLNANGHPVEVDKQFIDSSTEEIAEIHIFSYAAPNGVHHGCAEVEINIAMSVIQCLTRKLERAFIWQDTPVTPAYLALLVTVIQHTDEIIIRGDIDHHFVERDDSVFGCLMGCLMQQGGPKSLHLKFLDVTTRHARVLFEGIAASPCLENLKLDSLVFENRGVATTVLENVLSRNGQLQELHLVGAQFAHLRGIFRAAVLKTKVRSISVCLQGEVEEQLNFASVLDILSHRFCELESLDLSCMDMPTGKWDDNQPTTINTSIKRVCLDDLYLQSTQLEWIGMSFDSIESLCMKNNDVNDLSQLDTLLVGDDTKLEILALDECKIDETSIIAFFRKLQRMTCIRRVDLVGNPFLESNRWMGVLLENIQFNASLECITCFYEYELTEERRDFCFNLEVRLALNRGWKCFMESGSCNNGGTYTATLANKLWPLVLERASRISYFSCCYQQGGIPSLSTLGTDVIFWILREKIGNKIV